MLCICMSLLLSSPHTQGGKKFLNGKWNVLRKVQLRPAARMHALPQCTAMLSYALHVLALSPQVSQDVALYMPRYQLACAALTSTRSAQAAAKTISKEKMSKLLKVHDQYPTALLLVCYATYGHAFQLPALALHAGMCCADQALHAAVPAGMRSADKVSRAHRTTSTASTESTKC